ncbi:MAG: DUF547 domain-containing protein [Proteobacteria bacterium]|nr:DUF547 domain-containing protein [Pseudomonadota bacterium]
MAAKVMILNSETDSGREPTEEIHIALRKAIADLQADFFDLEAGKINYDAMRGTKQFNNYVRLAGFLKKYDLKSLTDREQRLAFWINLYNTMVIHGIVSLGIKESVKEKRGFFDRVTYDIAGYLFSLNDIEHGILRGNKRIPHRLWRAFGRSDPRCHFIISPMDVRIHFALVCGSQSCPPIGFYNANDIESQLELATQTFVNSKEVEIILEERVLRISQIFKWYGGDFGGRDNLIGFIIRYLDYGEKKGYLRKNISQVRIQYKNYDWSLNH